MSSANDSFLPLCGVADARMSASVLRGEYAGELVVAGPALVRLCDSSMTTTSQRCFSRCARYRADLSVSIETITLGKNVNGLRLAGSC